MEGEEVDEERWSRLLLEVLTEIMQRVDASAERWPPRRDVVCCACVCRRWCDATVSVVRASLECGRITFPSSLKQPGPRDAPMHCFIRRNKKNSTFHLYLSLKQALTDKGKFCWLLKDSEMGHIQNISSRMTMMLYSQGAVHVLEDEVQVVSLNQVMSEGEYMLFYLSSFPGPPRIYIQKGLLPVPTSAKRHSSKSSKGSKQEQKQT